MNNIFIRETYTNETIGYCTGESGWFESYTTDIGKLFKHLQQKYGRCISKMYQDPDAKQIGWVFQKRYKYTDVNETYIGHTWVQVSTTEPKKTTVNIKSPWE